MFDRAFAYGDGVFETVRVCGGYTPLWLFHRERLLESLQRLKIPLAPSHLDHAFSTWSKEHSARPKECVVKWIVSRGQSARGYQIDPSASPVIYVQACQPFTQRAENVRLRVCETRLAQQPVLAGMKHVSRLEQVMARLEWSDPAVHDGILLDTAGNVIETTSQNIYLLNGQTLITPRLDQAGVAGVFRRFLSDIICPIVGLEYCERPVSLADIAESDACFVSNAVSGLRWVSCLDDVREWRLHERYRSLRSAIRDELGGAFQ